MAVIISPISDKFRLLVKHLVCTIRYAEITFIINSPINVKFRLLVKLNIFSVLSAILK